MNRPHIREGDRFDKLTVLHQKHSDQYGKSMFYCKCECGNRVTVRGSHLATGHTTSCGCKRIEALKKM